MEHNEMKAIVDRVYCAMEEKGYSPVDQLIGCMLTEDPTYITNHKGARQQISKIDGFDLLRDILVNYIAPDLQWCAEEDQGDIITHT